MQLHDDTNASNAGTPASLDVAFINPFIRQTIHAFDMMLGWTIERESIQLKSDSTPAHDIAGMVILSGKVNGPVVLTFSRELACKMISELMGTEIHYLDEQATDLVGELTNTLCGRAAGELSRHSIRATVPSILIGNTSVIPFPPKALPVSVAFRTPWTPIALEVGLAKEAMSAGNAATVCDPAKRARASIIF